MALKSLILRELSHSGALSRADLARRLGVSPSRISEVTATLLEEGIICSAGYSQDSSRGRKSLLLDLDCSYKFAIGINIYSRLIYIGITTVKGEVLGRLKSDYTDKDDIFGTVMSGIMQLLSECSISFDRILGVGLCAKSDTEKMLISRLKDEFAKESVGFVFEPSDEYLLYSQQCLPIHSTELFKFGCAKVIRDVFIGCGE